MSSIFTASLQALFAERITPATDFPQFRKLPPELRRMVWSFTIPKHRVIKISSTKRSSGIRGLVLRSNAKLPILLSVSSESRQIARNHFTVAFELVLSNPVYFSFRYDTILFEDRAVCQLFQERNARLRGYGCDEVPKIRHLMIKLQNNAELDVFDDLGNLDTLIIGFDHRFRSTDDFEQLLIDIETYCTATWVDAGVREKGGKTVNFTLMEWRQLRKMVDRMNRDDGHGCWTQLMVRDFYRAVSWADRMITVFRYGMRW